MPKFKTEYLSPRHNRMFHPEHDDCFIEYGSELYGDVHVYYIHVPVVKRRLKIATQLVQLLENMLVEAGTADSFSGEVSESNTVAVKFWKKQGVQLTSICEGWYEFNKVL